jgi:hypothetical protein
MENKIGGIANVYELENKEETDIHDHTYD